MVSHPYGTDDQDQIVKFSEHVRLMREACIHAPLPLPDEELIVFRDTKREPMTISTWPCSKLLPKQHHPANVVRRKPGVFALDFGHPHFRVDFDYWAKMPHLGQMEASLLSVGADPKTMDKDEI